MMPYFPFIFRYSLESLVKDRASLHTLFLDRTWFFCGSLVVPGGLTVPVKCVANTSGARRNQNGHFTEGRSHSALSRDAEKGKGTSHPVLELIDFVLEDLNIERT